MQILHLDCSPLGDHSETRKLSRTIVEKFKRAHPDAGVVYRDLAVNPPSFVSAAWILGAFGLPGSDSAEAKAAIAESDMLVDELLAADVIVIGAPMYNLSIPAVLKAWIDQIVRPMRTFIPPPPAYKPLAVGKRAIFAIAAGGGGYDEGGPRQQFNHEDPYLRSIFAFIGIEDVQFVHFYNTVNERREQGERSAQQSVKDLVV
ncbi:MAG: NAD(P)H-dependent oxidoreductase [Phycisphaerales bacterium]|nr:NAD(P)H-dependent oxidoreductase [Phycisphaerales bacterium]